ncbi:MAG: sulfite exporter TauE/SafE family protein [Novosphingobium sp.]|nr:sulfite exporter TauE/SafE family protein [Novosphingobium sp.]
MVEGRGAGAGPARLTALGLPPAALAFALTAAFLAAFVRGLAGFGMAILLVPLLGLMILPVEAVVVSNLLGLLIGFSSLRQTWSEADQGSALTIGGLAMLATPVGLALLHATDPAWARLLIALVAVLAFVLVLLPPRPDGHRPHIAETGATGLAAGALTGFAGMPGPPVVPYYLRQSIPAARARASMLIVFFATSLASSVAGVAMGMAGMQQGLLALLLIGPIWIGNRLGGMAFGRVSDRAWRWLVALLLAASGIAALVRLIP